MTSTLSGVEKRGVAVSQENELRLHACNLQSGFRDEVSAQREFCALDQFTQNSIRAALKFLVSGYINDRNEGAATTWRYSFHNHYPIKFAVAVLQAYHVVIFLDELELRLHVRSDCGKEARLTPKLTTENLRELHEELGELLAKPSAALKDAAIQTKLIAIKNFLGVMFFQSE